MVAVVIASEDSLQPHVCQAREYLQIYDYICAHSSISIAEKMNLYFDAIDG